MPPSQSDLKDHQKPLVDAILKILTAPEPYPTPGRPIRNLAAQCLVAVYTHGDSKTLFDTIQTLLKPLDAKAPSKDVHKVCVCHCSRQAGFGADVFQCGTICHRRVNG